MKFCFFKSARKPIEPIKLYKRIYEKSAVATTKAKMNKLNCKVKI